MEKKGRMEDGENQYKLTLGAYNKKLNTQSKDGLLLYYTGRMEEAERQYKLALEANQNNASIHLNYGILLKNMGRIEEAENQYKLALEIDPKDVDAHYNYGNLMRNIGRLEEAENHYKLALEINPKHAGTHSSYYCLLEQMGRKEEAKKHYKLAKEADPESLNFFNNAYHDSFYLGEFFSEYFGENDKAENAYKRTLEARPKLLEAHYEYGCFLQRMDRMEEAENQYRLALETDPKHADTHLSYGKLLEKLDRMQEAENHYNLALAADPKHADSHLSYGHFLKKMNRIEEAKNQYELALEIDPKNANAHFDYARILSEIGRFSEAEEHSKLAIELNPKEPFNHVLYSLLLVSKNLEKEDKAIEQMLIASRLFKNSGDLENEHLFLAFLYGDLANKYYYLQKYQESGKYAELSGNKFIEASKHAGEDIKSTFLANGYMLKGRAYIRKLNFHASCDVKNFENILDGIDAASKCYKRAAEASPKDNQMCSACSLLMRCLSEILNYMLAVTKQEEVPKLRNKFEEWEKNLEICKNAYNESDKGKKFIQSLQKMILCVENYDKYKKYNTWEEKRDFKECINDLIEIVKNIEGPLQKVIEKTTKQMEYIKSETLYTDKLESSPPIEFKIDIGSKPNIFSGSKPNIFSGILEHPIIAGIIATILGGIVLIIIQKKYFP
jgi:tetratricopeptide (TPR) repeat protein